MTKDGRPRPGILKVFYECPAIGRPVDGADPTALDTASALALGRKFLTSATDADFFGFIDHADNTLQMYHTDKKMVWLEVPAPDKNGSHGAEISIDAAQKLLDALPERFGPDTVPGATLRPW